VTRILYLTPGCFDKGGISRYGRYQIEALREIVGPANLRVLSLLGPDADSFETGFDVAWHGGSGAATRGSRARFALRAAREVALWRPDVILCAHVNFTPLVSRLAQLSGATTVLNVYGLELWSGLTPARLAHMGRMDHVISDCHATADHVRDEAMHADDPVVIWDCVDLERFCPGPAPDHLVTRYGLPEAGTRRIVLTLGRLAVAARHKGYDRLIEIWGHVRTCMPDAHLVVAGRGDDADRLKAKVADLGLSGSISFTGSVDEEDLAAIYRVGDVFCLVSDKGPGRGEGIPLTPLEAMASGVPVLVGNEDGSREAVDAGRNGTVVSPRDADAMTNALVDLLTRAGPGLAAEARAVATERFGYTAFVDKHRAFLADIEKGV
jgi:phosphatidylinositol alpha-1,6-mannosyltransferase